MKLDRIENKDTYTNEEAAEIYIDGLNMGHAAGYKKATDVRRKENAKDLMIATLIVGGIYTYHKYKDKIKAKIKKIKGEA